jgi:hypothetical protein
MTNRYGYGYGEEDPLASRRVPGVTGQRADEAEQPEHPADVREIDLAEDGQDDERAQADERVERLRRAAREEPDDEDEAHPAPELGTTARADEDADEDDGGYEDDEDDEDRVAGEAPPAGAATVDIGAPSDADDEAAAVLVVEEDIEVVEEDVEVEDEDARERAAPETGDAAGDGQAGMTPAPATPAPSPETGDAAASPDTATAMAPAGATPALRPGALLAVDAEAVRRQFIDIQAGFVDEPRQAVEQAGDLVEELHRKVMESLQAERGQLSDALDAEQPSTEDLRQALRAYRAYVDRLLGLSL